MKDKIEEILESVDLLRCIETNPSNFWDSASYDDLVERLTTLIQEERKDAVEGLLNKCCNKCRDLIYSNYALQGQEKKKRSVEKLVREK